MVRPREYTIQWTHAILERIILIMHGTAHSPFGHYRFQLPADRRTAVASLPEDQPDDIPVDQVRSSAQIQLPVAQV